MIDKHSRRIWYVFMVVIGLFFSSVALYEIITNKGLPAFSELEKNEGKIVSVYRTQARAPVPTLLLRTSSEEIKYRYDWVLEDELKALIGERVTVWGKRTYMFFGMIEKESGMYQLEHDGRLVIDYDTNAEWLRAHMGSNFVWWFVLIFFNLVITVPGIYGYKKISNVAKLS